MTQRPQPGIARLWIPHHSEASLQTWHCASKGYFKIATLHGPFESTKLSRLVPFMDKELCFGFFLLPFQPERVCIVLLCKKLKQFIISAIFSLYRGTVRIFPPDYLEGESQGKALSQSLGLLLIFLAPGQVGLDILWGLTQLKTRQHGKLQLEAIPLRLHITK